MTIDTNIIHPKHFDPMLFQVSPLALSNRLQLDHLIISTQDVLGAGIDQHNLLHHNP